ncbi:Bacteriophage lysis protein [compost metagenome]
MSAGWKLLLRALPYVLGVLLIGAALLYARNVGRDGEHALRVAEVAQLNADHRADLARIDGENKAALARVTQEARDKEAADQAAMAALDEKHFKELQNEKANSERTIAGLRSGAIRVREQYTCPRASDSSAPGGVPQASSSPGMGDGSTGRGFGAEDAAEVIAAADTGDRWATQLLACQAIVRRDRGQQ